MMFCFMLYLLDIRFVCLQKYEKMWASLNSCKHFLCFLHCYLWSLFLILFFLVSKNISHFWNEIDEKSNDFYKSNQ